MLRWFVTGAGGQLATAFEKTLKGEVFLSREAALDIRDADAVHAAVHGFAPDVILHTAAFTDVDGAETHPALAEAINVEGTRSVIKAVRGTHTTVVYFSSDYVFDGAKGSPYVESDPTNPLGVYGRVERIRVADVERGLPAEKHLALEGPGEGRSQLATGARDKPAQHRFAGCA